MLVLSRKNNESIVINDRIIVTVIEIRGDKMRLGIRPQSGRAEVVPAGDAVTNADYIDGEPVFPETAVASIGIMNYIHSAISARETAVVANRRHKTPDGRRFGRLRASAGVFPNAHGIRSGRTGGRTWARAAGCRRAVHLAFLICFGRRVIVWRCLVSLPRQLMYQPPFTLNVCPVT